MTHRAVAALIRHGDYQQLAETPSAYQPFPLTDKGIIQARQAAQSISRFSDEQNLRIIPQIACSKLLRAWQTASEMASGLGENACIVEEHADLAERCVGSVANLTVQQITDIVKSDPRYADLPADWKSDSHFCLPFDGAESLLEAGRRVANVLQEQMQAVAIENDTDQLKIFVGHGAAFRHAAFHLGILEFQQIARLSMFHCQPVYIELQDDGSWRQVAGEWKIRSNNSAYTD